MRKLLLAALAVVFTAATAHAATTQVTIAVGDPTSTTGTWAPVANLVAPLAAGTVVGTLTFSQNWVPTAPATGSIPAASVAFTNTGSESLALGTCTGGNPDVCNVVTGVVIGAASYAETATTTP